MTNDKQITRWIAALDTTDLKTRREARQALTEAGAEALPQLLEQLENGPFPVRWEVAKALGDLRLADSAEALVRALADKEHDVRWLAAVALAQIGRPALAPLLNALAEDIDSLYLRQGTHHVLTMYPGTYRTEPLAHVRDLLGPFEKDIELIPAVHEALKSVQ